MRILLSVEHPAWVHQFKYMIRELEKHGHIVKIVAIKKDIDLELMDIYNIKYDIISNTSGKNIIEKGLIFLRTTFKIYQISKKFKPDIYIGRASPMMAINSFLFRKTHILFEDTEHSTFCLFICKLFSDVIITPNCFKNDLGRKQVRINAYKELFYLHPNYFTPDPAVLSDLNLSPNDKYIIVRFVAWDAHHDIGHEGIQNKIELVRKLEKYGRVLITSEGQLSSRLAKYQIKVSPAKMHDLLFYATLLYGESSTMASECAVLGTHAIYCDFAGRGYTDEEEEIYGLVYNFKLDEDSQRNSLEKAVELLEDNNLKRVGRKKREKLLEDKIDATAFMIWFVENYPDSFREMRESKGGV